MVTMRYKYRVVITFKDIPLQQGLKLHLRADGLELRRAFKDIPLQQGLKLFILTPSAGIILFLLKTFHYNKD